MLEKTVEARLVSEISRRSGLCLKWVSPGNVGVPDRIVIVPPGLVWFIELKREGGTPSAVQRVQHRRLSRAGAQVRVVTGMQGVEEFLKEVDNAIRSV